MNETAIPWEDDERIDRLVDGELTRQEYRELLTLLARHPDGWRRCALAFLEAQAWQRELGSMQLEDIRPPASSRATSRSKKRLSHWLSLLALAASFLMMFALGVAYHARRSRSPSLPGHVPVAQQQESADVEDAVRDTNTLPMRPPTEARPPIQPRGYVTLARDGVDSPSSDEFEIPLYEWSPESAWLLDDDRWRIPPEVQRALQRMGREIRWDRRLVPLETEDGSPAFLPMRRLEVMPVKGHRYQ
jgi:hypothetical protein